MPTFLFVLSIVIFGIFMWSINKDASKFTSQYDRYSGRTYLIGAFSVAASLSFAFSVLRAW